MNHTDSCEEIISGVKGLYKFARLSFRENQNHFRHTRAGCCSALSISAASNVSSNILCIEGYNVSSSLTCTCAIYYVWKRYGLLQHLRRRSSFSASNIYVLMLVLDSGNDSRLLRNTSIIFRYLLSSKLLCYLTIWDKTDPLFLAVFNP